MFLPGRKTGRSLEPLRRMDPIEGYDAVVNFHQPEKGYRFSADSIALAGFVELAGVRRAADLGAGCGVVGLTALEKQKNSAYRAESPPEFFYFIERDPELLSSLEKNIALYQPRTDCRLAIWAGDWRELSPDHFGGSFDYIMVNPPYFPADGSRPSPYPSRAAGRREMFGGLPELCGALTRLLTPGGRAAIILPAARQNEFENASQNGLTIMEVHPTSDGLASPLVWLLRRVS